MPLHELISDLEVTGVREDVRQLFVDEGTIHRPDSSQRGDFDPDTAEITSPVETLVYSGLMSIYPMEARRDTVDELGQGLIYIRQYRILLPWDAPEVQIRDMLRATTSRDPKLVGRPMEVRDVFTGTNVGYRRLTVHDVGE